MFARIEERWGRDPAAPLELVDDVLAHNLRAAFLITLKQEAEDKDEVEALEDRARTKGAEVRRMVG